jgi:TolB-like protein/Flp pilus assembly protein TadD
VYLSPVPEILESLRAALTQRYDLDRELGRGGMAVVYLARDLRHDRPVALKVLHPTLAVTLGPDRFLREIQIAARLQHPHIVPLFDSGQAGELLYYVMPYVEGESLRERLERDGPMAAPEALEIARQVAGALDYAHRRGIVHRDIKPANVLMHDGLAMVSDFGIARAVSVAGEGRLTQTGLALGTPAYMSPEQAAGAAEVDGRSDIYSLGCTLYEMLSGRPPFVGPTAQAILAQCLADTPSPLRAVAGGAPAWVERVVMQALAREPAARFATAAAFAQALRPGSGPEGRAAAGEAASGRRSIAVLPFVNMSADADNEYFSDGIAEEITNALTRIRTLRVAARTSAFAFKAKNADIGSIGQALRVATVLEGSVRRAGTRLRVTAQLIDVAEGYHLWSERYDRELVDVFAIQDEIAQSIVRALAVVLSDEERNALDRPLPTSNIRAYEYYLRGRHHFHLMRPGDLERARSMFEQAIALDPEYALAYAGTADCCSFLYMYFDSSQANLEASESASKRALELAPVVAEAHASRGLAVSLSRRHEDARREFDAALRLDPQLFDAHYFFARLCIQEGKLEEAAAHFEDAARVRREDYQALLLLPAVLRGLGRHAEAEDAARRGLERADKHLALSPDDARALYLSASALAVLGEAERARERIRRAREAAPRDPALLYNIACVYILLRDHEAALQALEEAVDRGFAHKGWLEHDADLDALRDDPRFTALLARL